MIYSRLKALREDHDLTQQKIADILYISRRAYSSYETGFRSMSPEILTKLANFYNVSVDYLLDLTDNPKRNS